MPTSPTSPSAAARCVSRADHVRVCLGDPQVAEHLGAVARLRRLVERAPQVGGRRLGRTLCERPLGGLAQGRHHERIAGRHCPHQMCSRLFRDGSALQQDLGRAAMRSRAFIRAHILENRGTDDRVGELERVLVPKQVRFDQFASGTERRPRLHIGQFGRERQFGPIAERCRRPQEPSRLVRQTREARRDSASDCLRPELDHVRCLIWGRTDPLLPNRVQQRDQEERIAA